MIKAEWTNADALNLQPTCNQLATDCISRQAAIDKDINVPTNDTISRQAAINELMKRDKELRNINWYDKPFAEGECKGIDDALEIINTLPSAQPERKMGRWILWNYPGEECAICSACGEEYDQMELYIGGNDYPKYCPNCGAAMRQPEDDIPMEYFENGGTV